jgi:hypothetical protein
MFSNMRLDNFYIGIPVIISAVAMVVFGHVFVHKKLRSDFFKGPHEITGYYFSIVATIYAVTLGLVVVDALNKFEEAASILEKEASSILIVYKVADQFKAEGANEKIKNLTQEYLDEVIGYDWKIMDEGKYNTKSRKILNELFDTIKVIEPSTGNEQTMLPLLIGAVKSMWEARRERVYRAQNGINSVEWLVLLIGAFVTIIFTYFFTADNYLSHLFMNGLVSLIIFINLYIVLLFGQPFTGNFTASKSSLLDAREIIRGNYSGPQN